jgi:hypothetical protein
MRHARCRTCDRMSTYDGFPDGWYQLTVNDSGAPNGKYRYLGLFCSIVCLSGHLPVMSQTETEIDRRRERQRT